MKVKIEKIDNPLQLNIESVEVNNDNPKNRTNHECST